MDVADLDELMDLAKRRSVLFGTAGGSDRNARV